MQTPQRYIAHFDLDSFFVSVEMLLDPSLLGTMSVQGTSCSQGISLRTLMMLVIPTRFRQVISLRR